MTIFAAATAQTTALAGRQRESAKSSREEEKGMAGYAGKINNGGTQVVKAPGGASGPKGTKKVKSGSDLRNKGSK